MKSLFAVVSTIALLSFKSNCIKKFLHSNWCQASETISLIRYGQRNNKDTSKKSPMELINEVPPIKVEGRIAACEGDTNPALGHPIEYICLDLPEPAICKYCGLRFVQDHHH
ncbi:NADH dehydrogenase [ubiquinone] iron-sulfur protein 6, mitochondrial [Capsicum annuum]|uniref:NADH dehydrogenase [ubiquinone] iron-sulfur protein 6, mitochondrial n=1 Tax=Capsicum annuum TaxID=4072 RepID=A0A2G3A0C8_CAPAN|nr:NADH dehydrogenase [ubiquinone] iron-sulfur protein 6, mitochondrial [Capsicum annuum]